LIEKKSLKQITTVYTKGYFLHFQMSLIHRLTYTDVPYLLSPVQNQPHGPCELPPLTQVQLQVFLVWHCSSILDINIKVSIFFVGCRGLQFDISLSMNVQIVFMQHLCAQNANASSLAFADETGC